MSFKYKVVVLQHRLLHYRLGLFENIRQACADLGIDFHLVHGQATRRESVKKDEGTLPWANAVTNKYWEVGERDILWQPYPADLKDVDLVVVMQESRILSNYPLLLSRLWSKRKVAYWGHGVNFQSDAPSGLRERWKQLIINKVDWWFAYTQMTVDLLHKGQYPKDKITCLNNAIDTSGFKADLASCSEQEIANLKLHLGISQTDLIALYCGSLYADKKLDLLVNASDKIRQEIPNFVLLVVGDGPSMPFMKEMAKTRPWVHLLGVRKGKEKALFFKVAQVMLNPGLVGLHVVDAFCAGLVMITTKTAKHSPEVAYLENGVNGISTEDSINDYSDAVINLLKDNRRLAVMQNNALEDSEKYSLENMVMNFVSGIKKCLETV